MVTIYPYSISLYFTWQMVVLIYLAVILYNVLGEKMV